MTGFPTLVRSAGRARSTGVLPAVVLAAVVLLVVVVGGAAADRVTAHDDIAGSEPEPGAQLDEPISEVTVDFGEEISEDVEMAIVRDTGDGTFEDIVAETARVEPTVARLSFDPLERDGRYFVRYLAPVPVDGHVIEGAIFFDLGEVGGDGSTSVAAWLAFGAVAVAVLGLGAWLSLRRHRALGAADGSPVPTPADESHDDESGDLTR